MVAVVALAAKVNVSLTTPWGAELPLFSDIGGNGDNFTKTTLDDSALLVR